MPGNFIVPQTPDWVGANAGSALFAGQVNQFMGGHQANILFQANIRAQSSTATATSTNQTCTSLYVGIPFTTTSTQTTVGYISLNMICSNPGSPTTSLPITVGVYPDSGSNSPVITSPLVLTTLTREFVFQAPYPLLIPIPVTGLTPSTKYWIVTTPGPNDGVNYRIVQATTTSGGVCSTSSNGTTWTAQAFGLAYAIYDQVPLSVQNLGSSIVGTWEDGGQRWTVQFRKTSGTAPVNNFITSVYEYTAGQAGIMSYVQSYRNNVSTSAGVLTIVT